MNARIRGAWNGTQLAEFLQKSTYPIRLAVIGGDDYPRVVSLWYRFEDERILCVAHRKSHLVSLLHRQARVGFEVSPNEPPYRGVRGQGLATMEPLGDQSTLQDLLSQYLGGSESSLGQWLLSRSDEEMLISIVPERMYSWDYRERMADAGTNIDASPTV